MRSITYQETLNLTTETCANCGVLFALPEHLERDLRRTGRSFYCPNGHSLSYGKGEVGRLKDELLQAAKKLEQAETRAAQERRWRQSAELETETVRRSRNAIKGVLTKTKKRIAGGVCPCCNRTFQNLGRHMAGQHPGYATPATAEEGGKEG